MQSTTDPINADGKPKMDPSTEESIKQGKKVIEIEKKLDPAPDEKKEEEASKDAEKWRDEG